MESQIDKPTLIKVLEMIEILSYAEERIKREGGKQKNNTKEGSLEKLKTRIKSMI